MTDSSIIQGFPPQCLEPPVTPLAWQRDRWKGWHLFGAASFLVSVPVFVEAPLVRSYPWISLAIAPFWAILSWGLEHRNPTNRWGDLLWGFTLTWLAGSLYWGWLRWEPLLHLPVEAIGLPLVVWMLRRGQWRVGGFFYLGSLLGTAITDIYFYLVDLIPYWRSVMLVDPDLGRSILQFALASMQTPWALGWAGVLIAILLTGGLLPLVLIKSVRQGSPQSIHWWAFSGAILCTLVVDGLFWIAAGQI